MKNKIGFAAIFMILMSCNTSVQNKDTKPTTMPIEGTDFQFTVAINNDTLIQQGTEKIDSIGVNRINIEKYMRVKD